MPNKIEAQRHRNDAAYDESTPLFLRPIADQIIYHRKRISLEMVELQKEEWQIGPDPARYTAECRTRIRHHELEIEWMQKEATQ